MVGDWELTSGYQYATINPNGRIDINSGVQNRTLVVSCTVNGRSATRTLTVSYDNQLDIEGSDHMSGTSGNVIARYNQAVVSPTWSITSGSSNATIDSSGAITILNTGDIVVQAVYNGYTATKSIQLEYVANTSSQTIVDGDGSVTTITEVVVENQDGSTTTTQTATTTNADGSFSSTESQTIAGQDGASTTTSTTTNQDGSYSQSTSSTTAPAQDGSTSTTSNTTYYDENGSSTGTQTGTK